MKKIIIILLFIIQSIIFAQASIIGGLGVGGGVQFGYLNPGLKEINTELSKAGFNEIKGGMFAYGGGFNLLINNYRIGYNALSGKRETIKSIDGGSKNAKFEYGYYLATFGYEFYNIDNFHFCIDLNLGAGYMNLDLIGKGTQPIDWKNVWEDSYEIPGTKEKFYKSNKLTTNFFQYQPSLVIEYIYGSFLKIFLAGDYIGTIKSSWYLNNDVELQNMPAVNLNGYCIRLGINVGIFIDN